MRSCAVPRAELADVIRCVDADDTGRAANTPSCEAVYAMSAPLPKSVVRDAMWRWSASTAAMPRKLCSPTLAAAPTVARIDVKQCDPIVANCPTIAPLQTITLSPITASG